MAVRTVSAAGGNFNAGATWVGGVAPVAGDSIIADATSGNLTLTANTGIMVSYNFTGYTRTLALATFALQASGSVTLGSGMTITNTSTNGRITLTSAGATLTSNGVDVPSLQWQAAATLVGDVRVGSLAVSSSANISGANMIFYGSTITLDNFNFTGGSKLILRPTSTLTLTTSSTGMNGTLVFDTTNAITFVAPLRFDNANGNAIEFTKPLTVSNTLTMPKLTFTKTNSCSINAGTFSVNFLEAYFQPSSAVNATTLSILSDSISINDFIIATSPTTTAIRSNVILDGTYAPTIKSLYCQSYCDFSSGVGGIRYNSSGLTLKGGLTYSITERLSIGGLGPSQSTLGASPSVANIYFTGLTYSISNVNLSNINFVSPTVTFSRLDNTGLSSLSNVTGLPLASAAGGGGGSFTYVN